MKQAVKTIAYLVFGLAVLGVLALCMVQFVFGYNLFDRSGWKEGADGSLRYLNEEGEPLYGWNEIDGETYYFDPLRAGAMYTGWLDTAQGRYFFREDGARTEGWKEIDGDLYCFDPDGLLRTGWIETKYGLTYLGEDGALKSGWLELDGERYYLNVCGVPNVGWMEIDGAQYCFDADGLMQTGWTETGTGFAYLGEDGALCTGWLELDGSRYYLNAFGVPCVGWVEVDGEHYWFCEDGTLYTGWLEQTEGVYYLAENGAMVTGWLDVDGARYYLDESGLLCHGDLELDGKRYLLTEDGTMHTGWLEEAGERYYYHADGHMAVGRVEIDGVATYFTSTGKYFVLVNPWNKVPADYELNLVNIEGYQVDASCLEALTAMITDCRAAGYACTINSAYRPYDEQVYLFEKKVTKLMNQGYTRAAAEAETALSIAIPGTSEHQLGLAVDIKNGGGTYDWLYKNSWKYGFIMRYPYGETELTGIYYEPWHFRYVGLELAKELYDLGLCVEAYMNLLTEQANS